MNLESPEKNSESLVLPVFPLPDQVFFPGTTLPLNVFEPRYVDMIRDVSTGSGLIVASLKTGGGFQELGTMGRISDLEPLQDGRFKIRLMGLERMLLTEVPVDTPYRQARVEARPEQTGTNDASVITEAGLELLASYGMLRSMVRENEPLVLQHDLPFELVVNRACASLPVDASLQQQLLREDTLIGRQRLGLKLFSTAIETLSWLRAMKGGGLSPVN
jgi:Lon protease-like protein